MVLLPSALLAGVKLVFASTDQQAWTFPAEFHLWGTSLMGASRKEVSIDYLELESPELIDQLGVIGSVYDHWSRGSFVVACFYRDGSKYGEVRLTDKVHEAQFAGLEGEALKERLLKLCGLLHVDSVNTRTQYVSENWVDDALVDNFSREYFVSLPNDSNGCRTYRDREQDVKVCAEDITLRSLDGVLPTVKLFSFETTTADVAALAWELGSSIRAPVIDINKEVSSSGVAVGGDEKTTRVAQGVRLMKEFSCESSLYGKWAEFRIEHIRGFSEGPQFTENDRRVVQKRAESFCGQLMEYIANEPALKDLVPC